MVFDYKNNIFTSVYCQSEGEGSKGDRGRFCRGQGRLSENSPSQVNQRNTIIYEYIHIWYNDYRR